MPLDKILCGDALSELKKLPSESVDCVITSPPYWALRDYGVDGQLGLEKTAEEYIENLCKIFDEVSRVMKRSGTCFVNLGDTYYGGGRNKGNTQPHAKGVRGIPNLGDVVEAPDGPEKCLAQIPSRFAIAMAERGWILRNEVIWHKENAMPSSVRDRFSVDFEKIYFFVQGSKYYFEQQFEDFRSNAYDRMRMARARSEYGGGKWAKDSGGAIKTQRAFVAGGTIGRNMRAVWKINTKPFMGAHFAVFPEELIYPMVLAGCPPEGIVLDPFMGAGTTAVVALKLKRHYVGIDINKEYIEIAEKRIAGVPVPLDFIHAKSA